MVSVSLLKKPNRIDPKTDIEVYKLLEKRYNEFISNMNKTNTVPIKVFNPLTKVQMDQIEMIREMSKELQVKKDEDIRKQKQNAEEMAAAAAEKKSAEETSSEEKEATPEEVKA